MSTVPNPGDARPPAHAALELTWDGPARILLRGELDVTDAPRLAEALDTVVAGGTDLVTVELEQLSFADSAGLRAMCGPALRRRADVLLRHPAPSVAKLLGLLLFDRHPAVHVAPANGEQHLAERVRASTDAA